MTGSYVVTRNVVQITDSAVLLPTGVGSIAGGISAASGGGSVVLGTGGIGTILASQVMTVSGTAVAVGAASGAVGVVSGVSVYNSLPDNFKAFQGSGNGSTSDVKDFEKSLVNLPPSERVASVKMKAKEVAQKAGLEKDSHLSKINGRDVYRDPKTKDLYSVDTQHGRFEKTNSKGKHLGEFDFGFNPTKPADTSGGHNLKIK